MRPWYTLSLALAVWACADDPTDPQAPEVGADATVEVAIDAGGDGGTAELPSADAGGDAPTSDLPAGQTGHVATSCGSADQNLTPVDCTADGDSDAYCVFSNHCGCSEGFECASSPGSGAGECPPGDTCVPAMMVADALADTSAMDSGGSADSAGPAADVQPELPPGRVGSVAESCGAASQGLTPVDCTAYGDDEAFCVFSNHCLCGTGYECEAKPAGSTVEECDSGSSCVPIGG